MLLLSAEKTWEAAVQWPFLQGRLCCCASALSKRRWPSPSLGNLSSLRTPQQYWCGRRWISVETLHSNDWITRILSVTAVAFGWKRKRTTTKRLIRSIHLCLFCLSGQNGKIDMTFFTHDCFHFTIKGHEELAKGLWNNMVNNKSHYLEVKGQQSTHWHALKDNVLQCLCFLKRIYSNFSTYRMHLFLHIHSSSSLRLLTVSAWGRKDDCEQFLWPHHSHLSTFGRKMLCETAKPKKNNNWPSFFVCFIEEK